MDMVRASDAGVAMHLQEISNGNESKILKAKSPDCVVKIQQYFENVYQNTENSIGRKMPCLTVVDKLAINPCNIDAKP